jgi:hypothetical protein
MLLRHFPQGTARIRQTLLNKSSTEWSVWAMQIIIAAAVNQQMFANGGIGRELVEGEAAVKATNCTNCQGY